MKLTFVMPAPLNVANSRMHWRVKHKRKVAYWAMLDSLSRTRTLGFPKPLKTPLDKVRITASFVLGGRMDVDNLMARCKHAMDWLVTRGYLVDDGPKHLTWAGIPTQTVSRKQPATLTLIVETDE